MKDAVRTKAAKWRELLLEGEASATDNKASQASSGAGSGSDSGSGSAATAAEDDDEGGRERPAKRARVEFKVVMHTLSESASAAQ
jgi:hypothetical protein